MFKRKVKTSGAENYPKIKRAKRLTKQHNDYVDKEEMMSELEEYQKTKVLSEKLCLMFRALARRYANKFNFSKYSYKDDFVSAAVIKMISQASKFDVNRPERNPFAYFTQMAHNEVISYISNEKKLKLVKDQIRAQVWFELETSEGISRTKGNFGDEGEDEAAEAYLDGDDLDEGDQDEETDEISDNEDTH